MKTFKALGALLLYPTEELRAAVPEIRVALLAEGAIDAGCLAALEPLLDRLSTDDLYEAQEAYTALFDRARSLSLHLYEHVHGEARERGQAMVRLQQVYGLHGFAHTASELPDFLPLFCEFLSCIPEKAARHFLGDAATVIEALRGRLARKGSDYAAVCAALVVLAAREVDRDLLASLARGEAGDAESFEELDRAWEEAPVTFGAGDVLSEHARKAG